MGRREEARSRADTVSGLALRSTAWCERHQDGDTIDAGDTRLDAEHLGDAIARQDFGGGAISGNAALMQQDEAVGIPQRE